ncbi:hypothetical protein Cadr_000018541 [Camelus dromedarius]|uniref:Uncharacterized protein n=1 Tax=Camelus dromedarius TaxID=9838 RepID=A0A5N4D2Y1_CAMDR|nr:hypothetical protein Cadr_000018541 [Camelus dromedarius]
MSAVPGRNSDSQSLQAPFMLSDVRVQPPDGPGETGPLELGPQNGEGVPFTVKVCGHRDDAGTAWPGQGTFSFQCPLYVCPTW